MVVILGVWILYRPIIPQKVTETQVGRVIDATLFPLEYKYQVKPKQNKFLNQIIGVNPDRFKQVVDSLENNNPQGAVVFFYKSESLASRYVLYDINQLAKEYAGKVLFFVVAFDDDKLKLSYLLDSYSELNFRPLIVPADFVVSAGYYFNPYNVHFSEIPTALYKMQDDKRFKIITIDVGTKRSFEDAINGIMK